MRVTADRSKDKKRWGRYALKVDALIHQKRFPIVGVKCVSPNHTYKIRNTKFFIGQPDLCSLCDVSQQYICDGCPEYYNLTVEGYKGSEISLWFHHNGFDRHVGKQDLHKLRKMIENRLKILLWFDSL